jgi:hypothetical protein
MQFLGWAVLVPLQASMAYPSLVNNLAPGYSPWDDNSTLINASSSKIVPSQDDLTSLHGTEGMHTLFFHVIFFVIILVE